MSILFGTTAMVDEKALADLSVELAKHIKSEQDIRAKFSRERWGK